ncbi:MAG: hypothetical protein HOV67_35820, partial [Kribbellaceae bacterium]|nr:hypothetical protein [Kribbellaceae bacterium]
MMEWLGRLLAADRRVTAACLRMRAALQLRVVPTGLACPARVMCSSRLVVLVRPVLRLAEVWLLVRLRLRLVELWLLVRLRLRLVLGLLLVVWLGLSLVDLGPTTGGRSGVPGVRTRGMTHLA